MGNKKPVKINPFDVETIVLNQRVNYKLIDPTTVGSEHLTFGMVIVEPGGICEPGHEHDEQEEIFFCKHPDLKKLAQKGNAKGG
jgi:5-keto 4-deoxyuronate isomerase